MVPANVKLGHDWMAHRANHYYGCGRRYGAGKFIMGKDLLQETPYFANDLVGAAVGAGAFYLFNCSSEEGRRKWHEHSTQKRQALDDLRAIRQALDNGAKITITPGRDEAVVAKQVQ
jgi:hypothetical protein